MPARLIPQDVWFGLTERDIVGMAFEEGFEPSIS